MTINSTLTILTPALPCHFVYTLWTPPVSTVSSVFLCATHGLAPLKRRTRAACHQFSVIHNSPTRTESCTGGVAALQAKLHSRRSEWEGRVSLKSLSLWRSLSFYCRSTRFLLRCKTNGGKVPDRHQTIWHLHTRQLCAFFLCSYLYIKKKKTLRPKAWWGVFRLQSWMIGRFFPLISPPLNIGSTAVFHTDAYCDAQTFACWYDNLIENRHSHWKCFCASSHLIQFSLSGTTF